MELHLRDASSTPTEFYFWTDFIRQDSVADGGDTDFTAVASGTIAAQAANGGWARISGLATTDACGGQIQAQAAHVCTDGKSITFKTKAQLGESTSANVATESQLYAGLFPVDTTIDGSLPADGVYFAKADGGTGINCVVRVGGANVLNTTIANVMDKNAHTYGIGVYPNGSAAAVVFSIDGVAVCRADTLTLPASTVILTPSVAFRSGDNTGTKFVDIDYLGSLQVR